MLFATTLPATLRTQRRLHALDAVCVGAGVQPMHIVVFDTKLVKMPDQRVQIGKIGPEPTFGHRDNPGGLFFGEVWLLAAIVPVHYKYQRVNRALGSCNFQKHRAVRSRKHLTPPHIFGFPLN